MGDQAALILERLSRRAEYTNAASYVFIGRGGGPLNGATLSRRYRRARDLAAEADKEMPKLRFHDLRHTFGTVLAMKGENMVTIREYLGHSDLRMTERYSHFVPMTDAAEFVSKAFSTRLSEAEDIQALSAN